MNVKKKNKLWIHQFWQKWSFCEFFEQKIWLKLDLHVFYKGGNCFVKNNKILLKGRKRCTNINYFDKWTIDDWLLYLSFSNISTTDHNFKFRFYFYIWVGDLPTTMTHLVASVQTANDECQMFVLQYIRLPFWFFYPDSKGTSNVETNVSQCSRCNYPICRITNFEKSFYFEIPKNFDFFCAVFHFFRVLGLHTYTFTSLSLFFSLLE